MSTTPAGDRAVLWMRNGNLLDLGTLPGDTSSEATAINNAGRCGWIFHWSARNARFFVE